MAVSASSHGGLLLHVDPVHAPDLVDEPHVRRAEMRGRVRDGWLRVDAGVLTTDDDLRAWVDHEQLCCGQGHLALMATALSSCLATRVAQIRF
jgi:hypothetical protein